MSQKRLLTYGDIEMDILLKADILDPASHDVKVDDLSFSPGGSAANCAAVAGNLGAEVSFIGSVGSDDWGKILLDDLQRFHVDSHWVKRSASGTGSCVAVIDPKGERKFYSYRGANEKDPPNLPDEAVWQNHCCLHLSGYSFQQPNSAETAWGLLRAARNHGLEISLDPSYLFAKQPINHQNELFLGLDFFFPNLEEAALISGCQDPVEAALKLRQRGVITVVVTLGERGCWLSCAEAQEMIKMNPVAPVVDSTGAGDAFCGGFFKGRLMGLSLMDSCKLGSAAAAHIVTRMGAHQEAPTLQDAINILRQNQQAGLADLLEKAQP